MATKNDKLDYKKEYKELYLPKKTPSVVDVPEILYFMVDGSGDPNTSEEYKAAIEMLYGLTFTIKMSKMSGTQPEGYFEYVVPPLEGFWDIPLSELGKGGIADKGKLTWTSMIRQPEFVTTEVFENAKAILKKKKPELPLEKVRFEKLTEGLCVQIMHIGTYDEEAASIQKMNEFVQENAYEHDFSNGRRHHEIYLGDPRKTAPEKLRTVIRHPIKAI